MKVKRIDGFVYYGNQYVVDVINKVRSRDFEFVERNASTVKTTTRLLFLLGLLKSIGLIVCIVLTAFCLANSDTAEDRKRKRKKAGVLAE